MAFTDADLQSAAAKLATLDFSVAELEAIASTIRGKPGSRVDSEVSGFVFEPNGEPVWAKGFIPEVAGLVGFGSWSTSQRLVSTEEGETI